MKKILSLILCLALILSVFCFTACGGKETPEKETEPADESESRTETTAADNTEESKTGLDKSQEDAADALNKLGDSEGYEITMDVTDAFGEESEIVTGQKDGIRWYFTDDESGSAMVKSGEGFAVYDYSDGEWTLSANMPTGDFESLASVYMMSVNLYLYYANSYDSDLQKVGTGKIAGRDCDKLKFSESIGTSGVEIFSYVDKELGITLKWGYDVEVADDASSVSMEVTSFKTGSEVKAPELGELGEDYMDYTGELGWPDNSYTALIPQIPGTIKLSGISDGQFVAGSKDVTEDDFNDYVESLKDAGFELEGEDAQLEGADSDGNVIAVALEEGQMTIQLTKAAAED